MPSKKLPNYKWIKFHIDSMEDRDFMSLDNEAAGVYLKLYLLAARSDSGGLLCNRQKPHSINDLAWYIRIDRELLERNLNKLIQKGLLIQSENGYMIARFMDEQGPGDGEQRKKWRERQRKHREKISKEKEQESDSEKEAELKEEVEEEKEREEESHSDITVIQPPLPEFDFGDHTYERERYIRWYCQMLRFSPATTEDFVKEHVPTGELEARLERDRSLSDRYMSEIAETLIKQIHAKEGEIFANNLTILEDVFYVMKERPPGCEEFETINEKARAYNKFGLFPTPLALSKERCRQLVHELISEIDIVDL